MRNKIGIPTISRRTFEIIPGIDLPQLIIEDILVSYPLSPSPRKEYVIRAGPWYGSNQQEFTTAHIKDNEIELRFYGHHKSFFYKQEPASLIFFHILLQSFQPTPIVSFQ